MVGTPEAPAARPLILDVEGRLYLHRYFDYECRLARRLRAPGPALPGVVGTGASELLERLFAANVGSGSASAPTGRRSRPRWRSTGR